MAQPSGICASCGKSATQRCARCTEGLDKSGSPSPTFYCGKECQAANFQDHKPICRASNARKQLYRGVGFVQEVFYAFRELAFDIDPTEIKVVDGKIHFQLVNTKDGDHDMNEWPLHPFPKRAMSNVEDKKALLVWQTCEDAIAYMHELLKKIFEGIVTDNAEYYPVEQTVVIKKEHKVIVRRFPDGNVEKARYQHQIINVGLIEDDEQYVIDLAGAQFRQYRAVMPQKEYAKDWIDGYKDQSKFGYHSRRWKKALRVQNDPVFLGLDLRIMFMQDGVVQGINTVIGEWEEEAGKTVVQMLKQKETAYKADKKALIKTITDDAREYLALFKRIPQFGMKEVHIKDLAPWTDEEVVEPMLKFGAEVPQDVRDFLEEQRRKGTMMINMRDL